MKRRNIRIISAAAALTMCFATGCGSIEDAAPAAAAQTKEAGTELSETEPVSADADKAETVIKIVEDDKADDKAADTGFLTDLNCVIEADDGVVYDKEKISRMTVLALGQYGLIIDRDKQGYYDSINLPALLADENILKPFLAEEDCDENYSPETTLLEGALMIASGAMPEEQAELTSGRPEGMDKAEYESKLRAALEAAKKDLTAENAAYLFDDYMSYNCFFGSEKEDFLPEGFTDVPEGLRLNIDNDTVFFIGISDYAETGDSTSAEFAVGVLQGDWAYSFDVMARLSDKDGSSVLITDMDVDTNEYKGLSLDEIMTKHEKLCSQKTLNANAKTGYNIAAEFICDCEIEGKSLDEVFEDGSFKQVNSAEGLRLNASAEGLGKGDERFLEMLDFGGSETGTFYLGRAKMHGEDYFFIQYKEDESGMIGQYPDSIMKEDSGKAVWGTFFEHTEPEQETAAE